MMDIIFFSNRMRPHTLRRQRKTGNWISAKSIENMKLRQIQYVSFTLKRMRNERTEKWWVSLPLAGCSDAIEVCVGVVWFRNCASPWRRFHSDRLAASPQRIESVVWSYSFERWNDHGRRQRVERSCIEITLTLVNSHSCDWDVLFFGIESM